MRSYLYPLGFTAILSGTLFLTGCTPGFGSVSPIGVDYGLPPEFQYLPADGPESGVITSISPALIRSLTALQPVSVTPEIKSLFGEAPPYTIGPGDVVGVIVYDHPELLPNGGAVIAQTTDPTGISLAPGFIVGSSGLISYPYVGRIKLEGLTEIEAADAISGRLASYIKDPQVTVRIQSFRSRRAYVEGEVRTPGLQIFTDVPMTLAEAINRAGGIAATGDRSNLTLTRGEKTFRIDLQSLQESNIDPSRILLKNGDSVNVKSREESKIYVMGEILRPSAVLMHSGRLTLNEALGEAGGPNLSSANPGQIYVIRNTERGEPAIYHLNAKNPVALALAERFPLQPRDVIYIDASPLVSWNRLASLILPSAQIVNTGDQIWARHR